MKKTLLIAAAALAAGMLSVQAQSNVYSQNIVGYVNLIIPAGQFAFIGNQLSVGTNGLNEVIKSGLVSDPDGNINTTVWLWSGAGYTPLQYWTENDAVNGSLFANPGQGNGFYTAGGTIVTDKSLAPGRGAFLQNPASTNITVTLVGAVAPAATNIISLPGGYSALCIPGPVSQPLVGVTNAGFVGVSDPDGNNNDVIWLWSGSGYTPFQYWTENDAVNGNLFANPGQGDGFYTAGGTITNVAPKVGQAFFIQRVAPGTGSWTNKLVIP